MGELKPVRNIDVSDSHTGLRIALILVAVAVALTAFGLGIAAFFSEDRGWKTLQADTAATNCGGDFVCNYYLDEDGFAGRRKLDAARSAYTSACVEAYDIFESGTSEGGIASVNGAVNAETEVSPSLYAAFSLLKGNGDRSLYLAPVYEYYYSLFYCDDDSFAAENDPQKSEETAHKLKEILSFAGDERHIDLKLLGENRVRLEVSEEYAAFFAEEGYQAYLDLFLFKNAFIADFIAEYMTERGFFGTLSSVDGFTRSFLQGELTFDCNVFDLDGNYMNLAAVLTGKGEMGAVRFRDYGTSPARYDLFYTYEDGTTVTPYLTEEGISRSCMHDLLAYSSEGCAYTLVKSLPVYTAEAFEEEAFSRLKGEGVSSVYCKDFEVYCTDPAASLRLISSPDYTYTLHQTA